MAQSITLAEMLVKIVAKSDTREFKKFQEGMERTSRNVVRTIEPIARGLQRLTVLAGAVGAAAFASGSGAEREFVKLQTQLGDTAEQVAAIKPKLEELSKETGQSLEGLAAAFFNLKSSVQGISDENALEVITASAKGATIELGNVGDLALTAGVAIRQFGENTISGQEALDILHATIKSGTIPDTGALASGFGQLLGPGKELGLTFNELAAATAGYSQTGQPISQVLTAIRAAITQLNAPSVEAQQVLDRIFPNATDSARALRDMIGKEGLFQTLQFLRGELGDDTQALRRLVGDVNALGFVLDATGDKASAYTDALHANRNTTNSVNEGLEIYRTTGAFQAEQATNNLKLALDKLYNNILVPLLRLFGKLPDAIQTVILGLGAMQVASTVGLAPSLSGLAKAVFTTDWSLKLLSFQLKAIAIWDWLAAAATNALSLSFWRNVVAQTASRIAMIAGTIATIAATVATTAFGIAMIVATGPIGLVILGIAALIAGVVLLIKNWGWVKEKVAVVWDFILGAVQGVWNWIKGNWPLLLAILTGPIGLAVWAVVKFKDDIIGVFTGVKDAVVGIWQSIWDFILGVWEKIKAPIEAVTGFVKGVAEPLLAVCKQLSPASSRAAWCPARWESHCCPCCTAGSWCCPSH